MNEIENIYLTFRSGFIYDGRVELEMEVVGEEGDDKPVLTMKTSDPHYHTQSHWTGMDPDQILILVKALLDIRSQMLDLPAYRT